MDIRYSQIIGTPVLLRNSMHPAGYVRHVLIDPEKGKVVAFILKVLRNEVILPQDISQWGQRIVIKSHQDIVEGSEIIRVKKVQEKGIFIMTSKVFTKNGTYLGRVYDYAIHKEFFELRSLAVRKFFLGIIPLKRRIISAKNIIEITKNGIIVKESVIKQKSFKMQKAPPTPA